MTNSTRLTSWVNGEEVVTEGVEFPLVNPVTGESLGSYLGSTEVQVDAAFIAARQAYASWKLSTPAQRQAALLKLADEVESSVDELVAAEVLQTGKPREATRVIEVIRSADQLRFFAGAARTLQGTAQMEYLEGFTSSIRREPIGVIAQITPWNYPLMMAIWKLGPALAAGNVVVLKPAETTPISTVLLAKIASRALPPGVFNVVLGGREIGSYMASHSEADMVAITGSVRAGAEVMKAAAGGVKNLHLELGGKAPAIVFGDADLDAAAEGITAAGFFNAGQDCTAVTRVIVEESVVDEFTQKLIERTKAKHAGFPDDNRTFLGPLNSVAQFKRVQAILERLPEHLSVAVGGVFSENGYFLEPTVITGARQEDEVVQSELFAPVLTVQSFSDEEEALGFANGVEYGLASSVWTRNHGRAVALSAALEFGTVWTNCHQVLPAEAPHGGFKASGFGKDLSVFSVEEYTRVKHVMSSHVR